MNFFFDFLFFHGRSTLSINNVSNSGKLFLGLYDMLMCSLGSPESLSGVIKCCHSLFEHDLELFPKRSSKHLIILERDKQDRRP